MINMASGRKHIKLQYEWSEKLREQPYNCEFVKMEHTIQIGFNEFVIDVYGKNKKGEEFIIEIGNVKERKRRLLSETFGKYFIHILLPFDGRNSKTTEFSQQISIRIPNEIMRNIYEYAKSCNENNVTKTILFFIRNGAINLEMIEKIKTFLNEQEIMMGILFKTELENKSENIDLRNPYIRALQRDNFTCRKCGSIKDINNPTKLPSDFNNKTAAGFETESYITLCEKCKKDFQNYILTNISLEKFIEWFFA